MACFARNVFVLQSQQSHVLWFHISSDSLFSLLPLPPLLPPLLQITIICVFNHPCRSSAFKKENLNHRILFFSFNLLFLRRIAAFVSAFGFIFLLNWNGAPTCGISRRSETNPR
ncbi:hypothetical protein O6H91_19G013200 [Diphasiastrum complanatum]|uniref:Uncharacterized protein n=1 Tax=Diphasiastrum complanatum TaxID=34168 RepID=A0ACC2ASV7_DIPCM|nr:hypothetical protein O6H91_19G013200 [Diphasiastrum complanatum]